MFLMARGDFDFAESESSRSILRTDDSKINLLLPTGLVDQVTAITSDSVVQFHQPVGELVAYTIR